MASVERDFSRRPRRSSDTEARVLSTVERLLKQGVKYNDMSIQLVIDEAGLARSTFYYHFRDKAHLLSRLSSALKSELYDIGSMWESADETEEPTKLTAVFAAIIGKHRQYSAILGAIAEAATYDAGTKDFYAANLEGFEVRVVEDLKRLKDTGRTAPDLDPEAAARLIVWGGAAAIAHHVRVTDESHDAAFARELATTWWTGAYHRRPGPSEADG